MRDIRRSKRMISIALLLLLFLSFSSIAFASETYIRVGVDTKTPPFQFLDETGHIVGMHIDMMNSIAAQEQFLLEYIPFDHRSETIKAIKDGKIDIVLGAYSKDYSPFGLVKSAELSSNTICVVIAKKNLTKIFGNSNNLTRYIGALELDSIGFSQAHSFNRMMTRVMGSQQQLFNDLIDGKIDAALGIKDSMLFYLDKTELNEEYAIIHNYLSTVNFVILTRENDRALNNSMNRSMLRLRKSDQYELIMDKWIVNRDLIAAETRIHMITRAIMFILTVGMIGFLIIYYINRLLRKTVEEKTEKIAEQIKNLDFESTLRTKLFEFSPEGILLLQPDGQVILMNPQAKQIMGLRTLPDQIYVSQLPIFREVWREIQNAPTENSMPRIMRWLDSSHRERVFRHQMHKLGDEQNLVLMVEDVTIEEQEKQDMFESSKSRSLNRIVAGISHEIKNPLTSIRAYSALIEQQGAEKEFQDSFSYYVPREVDRINRLIESLINYSRPTKGNKEIVMLKKLIEDSMHLAEVMTLSDKIDFSADVDESICIFADRNQMLQVIVNLLVNSIDAVSEKFEQFPSSNDVLAIRIRASMRSKDVLLEIIDEGMGMSPEELAECTEPFYSTKSHGTGMGLALAKQFIQENDGIFSVQSEYGQGTWITMIFQIQEAV